MFTKKNVLLNDKGRHLKKYGFGRVAQSLVLGFTDIEDINLFVLCEDVDIAEEISKDIKELSEANFTYISRRDINEKDFSFGVCVGPPETLEKIIPISIAYTMVDVSDLRADALKVLKGFDGFVVPAENNYRIFKKHFDHVFILPLYSDNEVFKPRKRFRLEGKGSVGFIYVGTFSFRKGVDLLLDAFIEEFDQEEAHLTLICTESDPDRLFNYVLKIFKKYNKIIDLSIVTTSISDAWLSRYYCRHDCYINTSHGEGWGYPIVEASMSGLPVITPRGLPSDDYLDEGLNFFIDSNIKKIKDVESDMAFNFKSKYSDLGLEIIDVDIADIRTQLRNVFKSKKELDVIGMKNAANTMQRYNRYEFSRVLRDILKSFI